MNTHFKVPGFLIVFSLLFASIFGIAQAQPEVATGTVSLNVVECSSISSHGVLGSVPADCVTAGGIFTLYLVGDGTDDFEQILVTDSDGAGVLALVPGEYEVVEETTQTHFTITVTAGATTQVNFGFAQDLLPEEQPVRLSITSLVCKNYEAASFIVFDGTIPSACTQVGGDVFSLYLYGDGTDDFVQVTSASSGPASIDLWPGRYELIHEGTQMSTELVLVSGSDASMAFTLPAPVDNNPPAPTAVPSKVTPTPTTVKALPDTGAGENSDLGVVVLAAVTGAMLLFGAGMRIRKSE